MRIINIDPFFENGVLYIRLDALDTDYSYEKSYGFEDLETFAIDYAKDYKKFLKYALTNLGGAVSIESKEGQKTRLRCFEASHSDLFFNLSRSYSRQADKHQNHTVVFTIPPSKKTIMNLLACLSVYFNYFHVNSVEFYNRDSYLQQLRENNLKTTGNKYIILTLMEKLIQIGQLENNKNYDSFMEYVSYLSLSYIKGKELNEEFKFLDLLVERIQNNDEFKTFTDKSSKIQSLYTTNYEITDTSTTLALINSVKELFAFKIQAQAMTCFKVHDFNFEYYAQFKQNLINSLFGKLANDGGNYNSNYTEIRLLAGAKIVLKKDDTVSFIDYQDNFIYKPCYLKGDSYIQQLLKKEMSHLANYFGGLKEDCDVYKEFNFSLQCTYKFLQLGLINFDFLQLFFHAYHQAQQIVHYHKALENKNGENLIKTIPQDLLPAIVRQSNERFAMLPQGFFRHAITHGFNNNAEQTLGCQASTNNSC